MPSFLPLTCSCANTTAHLACTAELVICSAKGTCFGHHSELAMSFTPAGHTLWNIPNAVR